MKLILHKLGNNRYSFFKDDGINKTEYHFNSLSELNSFCLINRINIINHLNDNSLEPTIPKNRI